MCFSIEIDVTLSRLAKRFNGVIHNSIKSDSINFTALGPSKRDEIPVVIFDGSDFMVKNMLWSLTPKWSDEFPCKWSTYNARMERDNKGEHQKIYDVPTFKSAFRKNKFCLVPIRSAIEACYWGEAAGNIVAFSQKSRKEYFAIGLWEEWLNKKTGELKESCTLLTDNPYKYFYKLGHDRSIIVIDEKEHEDLLTDLGRHHEKSYSLLKESRVSLNWNYHVVRKMKDGWQKRVPTEEKINMIGKSLFS